MLRNPRIHFNLNVNSLPRNPNFKSPQRRRLFKTLWGEKKKMLETKCWFPAFSPFPTIFSKEFFYRVKTHDSVCSWRSGLLLSYYNSVLFENTCDDVSSHLLPWNFLSQYLEGYVRYFMVAVLTCNSFSTQSWDFVHYVWPCQHFLKLKNKHYILINSIPVYLNF